MELASKYNPADVEGKWYQYWLDHKLFSSKPDGREPYTIVIPPPNVTGVLHMGHMLNNTIQDILVRRARMEGKNACWVPGTDHASIATEAKVVNKLAAQGIKKTDLTRDEFLKHAWEWTDEHGGIILKQLRKLGASCDWDRTAFTMDEKRSESVLKVFVDLYNKGLIYRGVRMVNWDPKALTALSDEEVIYKEEHSKLYYLKYYVADDDMSGETGAEGEVVHRDASGRRYAVVATTRPETIMGDTAMCINPADPKNQWLKGKKVIVPLVNRVIPVIQDDYVDVEFGTGCLKVTPAHDVNDYMLGEKYNLPAIDIFNDNGTLSEAAGLYVGMDRFDVREQIEKDLLAAIQHAPDNTAGNKTLFTKSVARTLLAKIYAEKPLRDYSKVIRYCDEVKADGFELVKDFSDLFGMNAAGTDAKARNTKESILEAQFTPGSGNWCTWMFGRDLVNWNNNFTWAKWVTPSRDLINAFKKEGDQIRFQESVVYYDCNWSNYYPSDNYPFMYKCRSANSSIIKYRYADVLLLKAEALIMQDTPDLEAAAKIIDEVRERAGLGELSSSVRKDRDAMITALLNERRLELAFEGQRWFDLVRLDKVEEVMNAVYAKDSGRKSQVYAFDKNSYRLPIPQSVIDANDKIEQNPGY